MEDAEYYQGSFQDDNNFNEYRSQGSDDGAGHDLEIQEIDDLPDDIKLRREAGEPEPSTPETGEVSEDVPTFVTPRTGLLIRTGDDDDEDGLGQISKMAEQVDNPYLLHYKN